jgi:hypothetical protein
VSSGPHAKDKVIIGCWVSKKVATRLMKMAQQTGTTRSAIMIDLLEKIVKQKHPRTKNKSF